MACLKRKADEPLERNTVVVLEPVTAHPLTMNPIMSAISHAWIWCTRFYIGLFAPPTYTDMIYACPQIVAENHIQSSTPRDNGETAVKRHKMRQDRIQSRSRSTPATSKLKRLGQGTIEYNGCMTETDYRNRVEDFFAPPDIGFSRRRTQHDAPPTPKSLSGGRKDESTDRRFSEPCLNTDLLEAPGTPDSMSNTSRSSQSPQYNIEPLTPESSPTPQSSRWTNRRVSGNLRKSSESLEERIGNLLVTTKEEESTLHLSKFLQEKRARAAAEKKERERIIEKERREKERLAEERRREEVRKEKIETLKAARIHRVKPSRPIVQPLSGEWNHKVDQALRTPKNVPITETTGGTPLHYMDFQKLLGRGSWLNDESINGWIEWVVEAANKKAKDEADALGIATTTVPKFIAHNSFFYDKLKKDGPKGIARLMSRKKAPGIALMEVDTVFIPINSGAHWTIGVVRPVAKTIEYMDSMGGNPRAFEKNMREWLANQLGEQYVETEWHSPNTKCAIQNNGYDCGVFVCTNALCVARGFDTFCYQEREMTLQRRRIAAVLINKGFTGEFAWMD